MKQYVVIMVLKVITQNYRLLSAKIAFLNIIKHIDTENNDLFLYIPNSKFVYGEKNFVGNLKFMYV